MKRLFYTIACVTLLASCTEVIDVEVPDNTVKLVVEGAITTEVDSSFVRLTQSVGYFDNPTQTPYVTNATVTVNGVSFTYTDSGYYRPTAGYTGIVGTNYQLTINHNGKQYTSTSLLEPMFKIDTIIPVFKQAEGFLEEGYTVAYLGTDVRPQIKYTYLRFGVKGKDSIQDFIEDFRVLFDNRGQDPNKPVVFEVPFVRLQPGDTNILVFRSVDESMYRYLLALGNRSGGGGPFSTPPANLPSNIKGQDALGIFAAYDVQRYRTAIP